MKFITILKFIGGIIIHVKNNININYNQFMNLNAFIVFSLRMHYIAVPFLFLFFQLLK